MITMRKMTESDLEYVLANALDPNVRTCQDRIPTQPAYTAVKNDVILGVGGINWFWPKVGEIWLILTKDVQSCPIESYRTIRRIFEIVTKQNDFKRLQAVARTNWREAVRIVEKLGFTREGTMKKYCPNGDDVYMYSLIK